jgi:predicted nucleic acid-binding protein
MIVLDTNVLSEPMRPRPSIKVLDWMRSQPAAMLFTTTITEAEVFFGIAILPDSERRRALESAAATTFTNHMAGRILSFDSAAAREYANLAAARRRSGRPLSEPDARIAAIARSRGAVLATRNIADFTGCALEIVDPWR